LDLQHILQQHAGLACASAAMALQAGKPHLMPYNFWNSVEE
jgi:hypothetical protein